MVPDPQGTARQRSLRRQWPLGAGTGARRWRAQEILPGTVCCPLLGASLAGTWTQVAAAARLSPRCLFPRPPKPLHLGRANQRRETRRSGDRLSARNALPGIRIREAPELRPAPRRPSLLPLRSREASPARGACRAAPDPAGAATKGAGEPGGTHIFGPRPGQPCSDWVGLLTGRWQGPVPTFPQAPVAL